MTTWSYDKIKMGHLKLLPERFEKKKRDPSSSNIAATSLCLTHCGNFVVIGYSTGHVDRFNIQSGLHRATYGNPTAHACTPVRGVTTDALNHVTVTAGGDGTIKFWAFKPGKTMFEHELSSHLTSHHIPERECLNVSPVLFLGSKPLTTICLEEPISFLRTHHQSSMIALILEDFSIQILDVDTRTIVRKFIGHTSQITDATFSPDSRWLITSSMDCTIKTWNIPSGQLIDHFKTSTPCISIDFSPTGELLATAHVDYLGLFLWANKSLYSHITLKAIEENEEAPLVQLPDCAKDNNNGNEEDEDEDMENEENEVYESPDQIDPELISMSSVANSRWQNLLNIELIKKRNKPKAPPKAPQAAPFFLPTIPSLNFQFDLNAAGNKPEGESEKMMRPNLFVDLSPFGKLLMSSATTQNFSVVIEKLKAMGPSMIDFEIKSLSPEGLGSVEVMLQFFKMILFMLESNRDFELAQAYLSCFLRSHANFIAQEESLRNYLERIQLKQNESWKRLQDNLLYNLSIVQFLKTM